MKTLLTAFALASLSTPAAAATPAQHRVSVKTGDLNLSSEEGKKVLAMRIHRAAKAMCENETLIQLPQNKRAARQCMESANSSAMAAVESKSGVRSASR